MRKSLLTVSYALLAASSALGQTGSSYWGYSWSGGSPNVLIAYLTVSGSPMGSCNHVYTDSLALGGPNGLHGSSDFNNAPYSSTTAFTKTWNDSLISGTDGPYLITESTSAFCQCINAPFYQSPPPPGPVYLPPAITSLQDYPGYNAFTPFVDTPQSAGHYIAIWGSNFAPLGVYTAPTISVTGSGFHVGTPPVPIQDNQVNVPYWVDANAAVGTDTLTLTTAGGTASTTFQVGDASPVISNVNPTSFTVGVAATGVQITGQHLGTVCPSLTFPFALLSGYSAHNCTDTSVSVDFTPSGAGSGRITFTDNGYGNGFQPYPGQTKTAQTPNVTAVAQPAMTFLWNPLTSVSVTGTPTGGTFSGSFVSGGLTGSVPVSPSFSSSTAKPNTIRLPDPASSGGNTTQGATGTLKVTYTTNSLSTTQTFAVATFGTSCYITTSENDYWTGNSCTSISMNNVQYSGATTNPPGVTGTFCQAFLKEVLINGSGVSRGGLALAAAAPYTATQANWAFVQRPIQTASGVTPIANSTIAVDKTVIPFNTNVYLDTLGNFVAQDTGAQTGSQAIVGHRIDVYKGIGQASGCPAAFTNPIVLGVCSPGTAQCPIQSIPN